MYCEKPAWLTNKDLCALLAISKQALSASVNNPASKSPLRLIKPFNAGPFKANRWDVRDIARVMNKTVEDVWADLSRAYGARG